MLHASQQHRHHVVQQLDAALLAMYVCVLQCWSAARCTIAQQCERGVPGKCHTVSHCGTCPPWWDQL
jgi:hypothetical protein